MTRSATGFDLTPLTPAERERRARGLTADERRVLLDHGTERPFCGTLLGEKRPGVYRCRLCGGLDELLKLAKTRLSSGPGARSS